MIRQTANYYVCLGTNKKWQKSNGVVRAPFIRANSHKPSWTQYKCFIDNRCVHNPDFHFSLFLSSIKFTMTLTLFKTQFKLGSSFGLEAVSVGKADYPSLAKGLQGESKIISSGHSSLSKVLTYIWKVNTFSTYGIILKTLCFLVFKTYKCCLEKLKFFDEKFKRITIHILLSFFFFLLVNIIFIRT